MYVNLDYLAETLQVSNGVEMSFDILIYLKECPVYPDWGIWTLCLFAVTIVTHTDEYSIRVMRYN